MSSATSRLMPAIRRAVLAGADRTDGQLLGAFVCNRDADAFAGLVRRHGPMVLGVCRRVTGDHHTAEDAFQAVFLVLARRAAAVRPREQVGNWLYGVAYRTALKARAVLTRRRSREKQVDVMPESPTRDPRGLTPPGSPEWSDLQPVIDEELARLPAKLRVPVVLCDLEGRPQRDVARHLGVPPATLATRLATARRMLATRLTRRGVTLSGGALAGLLAVHGTVGAVPHALTLGITRAAEAVATGTLASGLVSAHAVSLSEGVMRMMMLAKLKAIAVIALTAVALTGGLGLGLVPAYAGGDGDSPAAAPSRRAESPPVAAQEPPAALEARTDSAVFEKWKELTIDVVEDVDDGTFLRRLCLDLRGTLPTPVESYFFISDEDDDKRAKVIEWLIVDEDVRTYAARVHDVPAERVRLVKMLDAADGKPGAIVILIEVAEPKVQSLAFSPDGQHLAVQVENLDPARARLIETRLALRNIDASVLRTRHTLLAQRSPPDANDEFWLRIADEPKDSPGRIRGAATGRQANERFQATTEPLEVWNYVAVVESDVEFLKRVLKDVRGTAPTALEEKYFAEDKDTKKREKLLDTLLKDPVVARKLGEAWKKKMLAEPPMRSFVQPTVELKLNLESHLFERPHPTLVIPKWEELFIPMMEVPKVVRPTVPKANIPQWKFEDVPMPPVIELRVTPTARKLPSTPKANKYEKLIDELLAAKKTDAEVLEAITLATLGRLPMDTEKKLTLGLVSKAADRKAAWLEVARVLATDDARKAK